MAAGQAGSGAHLLQRVLHLRPGDASASFALGQVIACWRESDRKCSAPFMMLATECRVQGSKNLTFSASSASAHKIVAVHHSA